MGKPRLLPLLEVYFKCHSCGHDFKAVPGETVEAPDCWWHPFEYSCACEKCGDDAVQHGREVGLLKAHAMSTGPRTTEGKAASAKNIEGHPTPEEAQQTRFNALKHGMYAQTATYFPARPGKYAICDGCNYHGHECREYSDDNPPACLRRVELFMKHQMAFDAKDPSMLTSLRSGTQAAIQAMIDEMIMTIAADGGPRIKSVEWYHDKDGGFHLAKYRDENDVPHQIHKLEEHPLLKRLIDYIAKNNLTLSDMGMTPKVQEDQDILRGHLADDEKEKESVKNYMKGIEQKQSNLMELISNSYENDIEDAVIVDG